MRSRSNCAEEYRPGRCFRARSDRLFIVFESGAIVPLEPDCADRAIYTFAGWPDYVLERFYGAQGN